MFKEDQAGKKRNENGKKEGKKIKMKEAVKKKE